MEDLDDVASTTSLFEQIAEAIWAEMGRKPEWASSFVQGSMLRTEALRSAERLWHQDKPAVRELAKKYHFTRWLPVKNKKHAT